MTNQGFSISESDFNMMMMAPLDAPVSETPQAILRRSASDDYVSGSASTCRSVSPQHEGGMKRRNSESDVQPLKKRRRVRIQVSFNQEFKGQNATDLPPKQQCWYSKEDLVSTRRMARKLSRQVNSDSVLMETYDKACGPHHPNAAFKILEASGEFWKQRGLERLSKGHAISRNIQVCSVKSAVLLEQSCQYLEGKSDPERLAQASLMASGPSSQFAHLLAMADQSMAQRIYSEGAASA